MYIITSWNLIKATNNCTMMQSIFYTENRNTNPRHKMDKGCAYLARVWSIQWLFSCTIFMNHPMSPLAFRSSTNVVYQGLLHPNFCALLSNNVPIFTSGFPVASFCCSVQSLPILIHTIVWAEEEPLVVMWLYHRQICNNSNQFTLLFTF